MGILQESSVYSRNRIKFTYRFKFTLPAVNISKSHRIKFTIDYSCAKQIQYDNR